MCNKESMQQEKKSEFVLQQTDATPIMSNKCAKHEPPPIPRFSCTDTVIIRPSSKAHRTESSIARVVPYGDRSSVSVVVLDILVRSLAVAARPALQYTLQKHPLSKQHQQRRRPHRRRRTARPTGIPNYGQTCFLNSTIQALAACGDTVTDYLEEVSPYSTTARRLALVLRDLQQGSPNVDPRPLLAVTQLQRHQQHDAQECLGAILSAIAEETDWKAYQMNCDAALAETDEIIFPRIRLGKRDEEEKQEDRETSQNGKETSSSTSKSRIDLSVSLDELPLPSVETPKKLPLAERSDNTEVASLSLKDEEKQQDFEVHFQQPELSYRPTTFSSINVDSSNSRAAANRPISFSQIFTASKPLAPLPSRWHYSASTPTPLTGWMGSRVTCQTCHISRPILHQPFLNLPVAPNAHSVSACLAKAVASDQLDSVVCETCTAAEKQVLQNAITAFRARNLAVTHLQRELSSMEENRGPAIQDLRLARLPAVLSLHVQRRSVDPVTQLSRKTATVVTIEPVLDVAPFTTNVSSRPIPYRLVAVLEHLGGYADAGHYVCYRRYAGSWWRISDSVVRPSEWSIVARCQAYMLFYVKQTA